MRSDRRPAFETCWVCPGHDKSETGPVIDWSSSLRALIDSDMFDMLCVLLSRMWLHEHGPRPSVMTVHVGPCVGGPDDRRLVTLSGVPEWMVK